MTGGIERPTHAESQLGGVWGERKTTWKGWLLCGVPVLTDPRNSEVVGVEHRKGLNRRERFWVSPPGADAEPRYLPGRFMRKRHR